MKFSDQVQRLMALSEKMPDIPDPPKLDRGTAHSQMAWERTMPARVEAATLEDFSDQPPSVRDGLESWATNPEGRNLLILGPVGVGKTHAAVAAVRVAHFVHGRRVRFLPVVELLDQLRPGGPDGALGDLTAADLLVVDDLGSERVTDWTAERLYALINRRWLEQRPTVCTTNLEPGPLCDTLGDRVFSRIVGNGSVVLRLTGPDRRRNQPKEKP